MSEEQGGHTSADKSYGRERPVSPAHSDVSMESDRSKGDPLNFSERGRSHEKARPVSPALSYVSMKSDRSKGDPLNFSERGRSHEKARPVSPAPSDVSMKSDRSKGDPLNFSERGRSHEKARPVSPALSYVSMKSDRSKGDPLNFSERGRSHEKERPVSPAPSDVSMKSDRSKGDPLNFSERGRSHEKARPVSPAPSNVSMKSDRSKGDPLNFSERGRSHEKARPVSPAPSDVSMKSDRSKGDPLNFSERGRSHEKERPVSPAPNNVSMESDRSNGDPLNFSERGRSHEKERPVSPAPSDVSMKSDRSKGDPLHSSERGSSPVSQREVSSMKLDQSEDDPLNSSKDLEKDAKQKLTEDQKKRILEDYEEELSQHETNTVLYETMTKKEHNHKLIETYNDIFYGSKKNKVRTVLMKGEAGVGKTFQTRLFMVDWANRKSNQNIDLIVPIHFSDLNSKGNEDQSMEDLLCNFFTSIKQPLVCSYDECEIVFVLDELEKCKLPLDFGKNEDLSDMKKPASIDVLLTNLIKGNLLPSARLWIISQHSGVAKIPTKYIHKVTECREKDAKQKLTEDQKKRILEDYEEELSQHETNTVLYETMTKKEHNHKLIETYNDIFYDSKKNKVRTVLMKGEAGVGKTFQTRLFMVDWANRKSNQNIDLIVPIHFSDLNSKKDEDQSMEDLLCNFFSSIKQPGVCSYDECEIVFVLDGLDKCKLPLNFKKNEDLSDMKKPALMDVLLTNLIKGNLLPSAHLWIISQPSGVAKIPTKYIHKVTECRDTLKEWQQLVSNLKKRFKKNTQVEDKDHPNKENTEHIMKEDRNEEINDEEKNGRSVMKSVTRVNSISEIFKCKKGQTVRTVLTTGEAGIGKSFHVQKFTQEWAKTDNKSSKFTWLIESAKAFFGKDKDDLEVLFPLRLSELNSIKEKRVSLLGLLNHFFDETKKSVISNYAHFKVLFVLDGLTDYELPLDFVNNDTLTDIREPASVDVLLTNLIRGNLLPSAQVWITSRPSGAEKLPDKLVDRKTEIREKDAKHKLMTHLKKKILHQYKVEQGQHGTDSELYEKKDKDKPVQIKYNAIINDSKTNKERTVLTRGVSGIGKTFQTRLFMVDWANEKSNKNIDLVVQIHFSDLNSKRDEDQSMEDLLSNFFSSIKQPVVCSYNECEIVFILDGLDKCELPLDFDKNEDLSDMKKPAPMDVLLTNLIKGNLLPSARLWIISQPSGVDKIPTKYIHKVTECRETLERWQQLVSNLKKRLKNTQVEDKDHPNKENTEHIMKEDRNEEINDEEKNGRTVVKSVTQVNSISEIFKCKNDQRVRTVLTTGETGIGKSFHAQKFTQDWAKNNDLEVLFHLRFSEINLMKEKRVSLFELLNHFFKETKESVISDYARFNVQFVLDGLDNYKLPLDFGNNDTLTDIREPASVDVLLTNLIRGDLLPSAQLWITSRPSAAEKLPDKLVDKKTQIRKKDAKHKLTAHLKEKILHQYKVEQSHHETDSELYEKKDKDKPVLIKYNAIINDSKTNKERTVLTVGVADIGKTFQTRLFMVDWANEKSNKNIDLIVPIHFSELNSKSNRDQSMEDLLHFLTRIKQPVVCYYDECEIVFVLDGLDKCELPLDFDKNEDLSDMKKPASIDVLLTNLIKGNLLPSARLWIISQPSGVAKIPTKYIHKETECQESLNRRQQLVSNLKKRFQENTQDENMNHPNKENTEHIMKEDRNEEINDEEKNGVTVTQVNSISEIFKCKNDQRVRTVLTTGETGIGKSFHAQKFTQDWAKIEKSSVLTWIKSTMFGKANNDLEVLFPLRFSELNLIKETRISLLGLLNHFFDETKKSVISNYACFKVLFVLDGLDNYELPLDFGNNDTLTDIREPASVDVLLTNLIRGDLLPSVQLWITSRPSAAKKLPDDFVDKKTQIREKPHISSQRKLKSELKEQFNLVCEGIDRQKTSALLNEIYTDLYIVEGDGGDVNRQHESRQVQDAKFKLVREETPIKYHDIFKPASGENKPIRTVLTTGVAGIGKTFASMKYMLDWAEGTANENIYYTFPFPFRELNLRKENEHSLEDLIHQFFPAMETSEITDYNKYQILIVLDGLDECRPELNFRESENWTDVRKPTSVNVLLTNLIQGNLLPKAQIWITSRPAASNCIPAGKVDRVTEVRGFNDEQKEEYFRKRFSDKDLAEKILLHLKKSRSIFIMCHIPVFCWITAKVLEDFVSRKQEEGMPKTLTDMYVHFLLLQCRQANVKYGGDETGESSEIDSIPNTKNKETILSLGKLAFKELEKGNLLFTEEHLTECGIDITETAVFSGLFTQIKREGRGLYQQKLFCFVHLSIQEFLAALYVFHTFDDTGENLLIKPDQPNQSDLYKTAVDRALDSKNGDWDLFLRFLLGLSLETNQTLLQELLQKTENKKTNNEIIKYIKEKIEKEFSDKNLNLFHCLNELNDHSLVEEVKKYLSSETQEFEHFSASQWSALTYVLLTSDENLDVFDLKKYLKSEKVLLGMLPVVKVSKTTLLSWCELSEESCRGLSSTVLSSASSNLTKLDLSDNDLLDSGVQLLADGLKRLQCKLEILKLSGCQVTEKGCCFLASALESNTASLKHLDLRYNHPGENGKMRLSAIAEDPNMKLKTLRLDHGGEHRLKPGLKKYCDDLRLDENTAGKRLVLSEGNRQVKTVENVEEKVSRPKNKDRFKRSQVLCEEGLNGFCYWEVEWRGTVGIAVAYKEVGRTWDSSGGLGCNKKSWSLLCSKTGYKAMHGKRSKLIKVPPCQKIAVLLDWEGGTLTYYSVTSGKLSLIHTFRAKFTEPLYPGFWFKKGSVNLCEITRTSL